MQEEAKQPIKDEGSLIEQAKKLHADIKGENDRREAILQREERLHAEQMIAGRASAGQVPEPPKAETDKEYVARLMKGDKKDGEWK